MKVTVCRPGELGPAEMARWREMQADGGELAHPFLTPEFTVAAGAELPAARVAVIEDGGVCGFWPFSRQRFGVAGPVAPGNTDREGVVHAPGADVDVEALLAGSGCSGWRFNHLIAEQAPPGSAAQEWSPAVDLSAGWEVYEKAREAEHQTLTNKYRAKMRRLQRRFEFSIDTSGDAAIVDWIIRNKSAQCRERGWVDAFGPAWTRNLLHRLVADKGGRLTARVVALRAGDDLCAGLVSLRNGSYEHHWIATYATGYSAYSPGILSYLEAVRIAAGDGVTLVDLGRGKEPHKDYLTNTRLAIADGFVAGPGARGVTARALDAAPRSVRRWLDARPEHHERAQRAVWNARRRAYRLARAGGRGG